MIGKFKKIKNRKAKTISFIILSLITIFFMLPYVWMIANSLKPMKEVLLKPGVLFPESPSLDNYIKVLTKTPFFLWLKNSIVVTVTNTLIVLITSSILGFIYSRYRFKGRETSFKLLVSTMMVPAQVTMIPSFILITRLGLYNNLLALIIPAFTSVYGIYLAKQFIDELPRELFESAELDGASGFTVYRRIVMPNIKPALTSLVMTTALGYWNDFLNPLIYLSSPEKQTLPLALSYFSTQHVTDTATVMAASALIILPISIVFIFFQKKFIKGITMTGMK